MTVTRSSKYLAEKNGGHSTLRRARNLGPPPTTTRERERDTDTGLLVENTVVINMGYSNLCVKRPLKNRQSKDLNDNW